MSPRAGRISACLLLATCTLHAASATRAAPPPDPLAGDDRLERHVTAKVAEVPLRGWLEALGREARVPLAVARDYEDRAVTVRAKELPLRRLMASLALLYSDRWVREKKEGGGYVLQASTARRARQRRLLAAFDEALLSELVEEARECAENGAPAQLLQGEPQEAQDHLNRDFAGRGKILAAMPREDLQRLLAGETLTFTLDDAPGALGRELRAFAGMMQPPPVDLPRGEPVEPPYATFFSNSYEIPMSSLSDLPLRRLHFRLRTARLAGYGLAVDPDRFADRLERDLEQLRRGEEQTPGERRKAGGPALKRRVPEEESLAPGRPAVRGEVLAALAEAADLNLVSDAHVRRPLPTLDLARMRVEEALDLVAEQHGCFWRAGDGVLRVRSRWWWLEDVADPPATALARWRALLEKEGELALVESTAIAALTAPQQTRLAVRVPDARSAFSTVLRLYAGLTERQRAAARSPAGLPLPDIPLPLRLGVTRGDVGGPFGDNHWRIYPRLEEALASGLAVLRLREEREADGRAVAVFHVDPLKTEKGWPRVQGQIMRISLPKAQVARPSPRE